MKAIAWSLKTMTYTIAMDSVMIQLSQVTLLMTTIEFYKTVAQLKDCKLKVILSQIEIVSAQMQQAIKSL